MQMCLNSILVHEKRNFLIFLSHFKDFSSYSSFFSQSFLHNNGFFVGKYMMEEEKKFMTFSQISYINLTSPSLCALISTYTETHTVVLYSSMDSETMGFCTLWDSWVGDFLTRIFVYKRKTIKICFGKTNGG